MCGRVLDFRLLPVITQDYWIMDDLPMKISGQKDYKATEKCFDL